MQAVSYVDAASHVHLRQIERNERIRIVSSRVDDPAAAERHSERSREIGRHQVAMSFVEIMLANRTTCQQQSNFLKLINNYFHY